MKSSRVPMTRSKIAALKAALGSDNNNINNKILSDNDFSNSSIPSSAAVQKQQQNNTNESTTILLPKRTKLPAFRCICNKPPPPPLSNGTYGLDVVQCQKCHNALHSNCVGLTRPEKITSSKSEREAATLLLETFVCNFCLKESGGQIGGVKLHNPKNSSILLKGGKRKTQSQLNAAVTGKRMNNNNKNTGDVSTNLLSQQQSNNNNNTIDDPQVDLQKILSIKECPDRPILNAEPYRKIIKNCTDFLTNSGYKLVLFPTSSVPNSSTQHGFTNEQIEDQVLECSRTSIEDSTFSEEYPLYCVREMLSKKHPYLQGAAAVDNKTKKIVAIVMSNGRDPYCDLRPTVENLKRQMTSPKGKVKLLLTAADESKYAGNFIATVEKPKERISFNAKTGIVRQRDENNNSQQQQQSNSFSITSSVTTDPKTNNILFRNQAAQFAKQCVDFFRDTENFDSIVHFTYIVTHDQHRGKKLAKTLMWIEMARWALRGRTNACVNMALEKVYHHYSLPSNSSSLAKTKTATTIKTPPQFLVDDDDEEEMTTSVNNNKNQTQMRLMGGSEHHIIVDDDDDDDDDDDLTVLECRVTDASRKLYTGLTFQEVFPRYNSDGSLRWTKKEENAGRMMVSLDFPAKMLNVLK